MISQSSFLFVIHQKSSNHMIMLLTKPFFHSGLFRLFIILILITYTHDTCAACNRYDKESLLPLATNFPDLKWSDSVDCCSWDGISCDVKRNRVIELSIPKKGLHGSIPSSLQNLTSLSLLNLSSNCLTGHLPDGFFSSFNNLTIIDLSYNMLSGHLPTNLPATLQSLDASSNRFNGTLQGGFFLSPKTNFISLNISNNSITGSIPPSLCTNSPSLMTLDFSLNDFTGMIPLEFGTCSNLRVLSLGFNNLTGSIPNDIDGARSMEKLLLQGNSLNGEIGESITNLTNLRNLALYSNIFSGSIPRNIGKLSFLERLELHINHLNGTIPSSLINCTKIKLLNLRVNSLVGKLADFDFSNFTQLLIIDLGENQFDGVLPRTLFKCKSLTTIRMSSNRLEGEVLTDVFELSSLTFLSFSNNALKNITRALDILSSLPKLTTLILSKNFYSETLPGAGILGFLNLEIMGLGGCKLFGQIPTWFRSMKNIEVIDISWNYINGTIPGWLQILPNLFYLDLSNNNISGGFIVELTKLPAFGSHEVLDHVNSSYLELPVFVAPQKTSFLQYNQLATLPLALYISSNQLSGNIPVEIGHMQSIHVLDLSNNHFSGNIPSSISNLTNLEKLDLSDNLLSGNIPSSLVSLYFLSSFDVANNNLEGHIPTGGQFDTFLKQTYEGNPGLCGPPLQNLCGVELEPPSSFPKHKKGPNKKVIVGLILGISLGVGIILTCIALWILSKRRILPDGDPEILDMDMVTLSSPSAAQVPKHTGGVILFPNNAKDIKHLTMADILKATEDFNQEKIIGCGGFGLVYKATFADGSNLAVKKLSGDMGLMEREFHAEIQALSESRHKHLVSLQGYCIYDGCRLLIYSFMENGSLEYWLHEKTDGALGLDWPTRLKIAQGASCGLAYLHQTCEPRIVHRDIKSSNILLDEEFEAHLADFGLSRMIHPDNTHVSTDLMGTLGYIPPEYSQSWVATLRGDVYSFGVVLLELLTGRRPIEIFRPNESRELVVWVQQLRTRGIPYEVFDPLLPANGCVEDMLQVLDVACICVDENPLKRPTINKVVNWLHNIGSNNQIHNGPTGKSLC